MENKPNNDLSINDKKFIKKVANDTVNMIINLDDIKKAYSMLKGTDVNNPSNIIQQRRELYKHHKQLEAEDIKFKNREVAYNAKGELMDKRSKEYHEANKMMHRYSKDNINAWKKDILDKSK